MASQIKGFIGKKNLKGFATVKCDNDLHYKYSFFIE